MGRSAISTQDDLVTHPSYRESCPPKSELMFDITNSAGSNSSFSEDNFNPEAYTKLFYHNHDRSFDSRQVDREFSFRIC